MTVVMLHNRFGVNARGGAETWIAQYALARRLNNDRVVIVVCDQRAPHMLRTVHAHSDDGTDVVRLPVPNITTYQHLYRFPLLLRILWHVIDVFNVVSAVRLYLWLRRLRPDRIITNNITGCGWLIRWAIRRLKKPVEWTHVLHDIQLLHPSGVLLWGSEHAYSYSGALGKLYRSITRRLVTPDTVIALSHWIAREHARWGFFHHTAIQQYPQPFLSSHPHAAVHTPVRIAFIGQYELHKGVLVLLDSLSLLVTQRYQMTFIGGGSCEGILRSIASRRAHWRLLDWQPFEAIKRVLTESDLLVFPSICYENAPMMLVEAMQSGIAIIASRIGGIPELVERYQRVEFVEPGSVRSLAGAIDRFIGRNGKLQ